jgi:DNA-binding protein H-NS
MLCRRKKITGGTSMMYPLIGKYMTRANYAMQRRKLEKEILRLQKQAAALEQKQRTPVINDIIRSMREYDITPEDIAAAYNRRVRSANKGASKTAKTAGTTAVRKPVPPKYRNPETDATWSGRGKPPRWITEAEAAGKSRDSFLINP